MPHMKLFVDVRLGTWPAAAPPSCARLGWTRLARRAAGIDQSRASQHLTLVKIPKLELD
jgi:hypothetical protein